MFYEGCTIEEIKAYRKLESETFDFGKGEMKIEGWYGFEDAYYKMDLECGDTYCRNKTNNKKQNKNNKGLNRYARKQIDKKKLRKLYNEGSWYVAKDCNGYIQRCYLSPRAKHLKKYSNKQVRKYKKALSNGNMYRRIYNYWWELL